MGHPLILLSFVTFLLVMAAGGWSLLSTHRKQKHGDNVSGVGGPNDPMS